MSALDKKFIAAFPKRHARYEETYRAFVASANEALHASKRAIFAFHRADVTGARAQLAIATHSLHDARTFATREPSLLYEGAYRAAVEEFLEATFYGQFVGRVAVSPPADLSSDDPELAVGGLADLTGELVRYATACATLGDLKEVARAKQTLDAVMALLINLDLTGYVRTKCDQARSSARRMEEICYDIALRARV